MRDKKPLGFWRLTSLVIGNMVGSGIFLLPSSLAPYGFLTIFAWLITGVGALAVAAVFANLAKQQPDLGGPYAYCRHAFGNFIGFQVAYNYWIYVWVGNAAIAISLVAYLGYFFPAINHHAIVAFSATTLTVWALTFINLLGIRTAALFQLITVILKLIPIILFALIALLFIDLHHLKFITESHLALNANNFNLFNLFNKHNFLALLSASTLTMWALTGVESATIPAQAVAHPRKNIPVATMVGTIISILLYIACTIAIMKIIPVNLLSHSDAPFADAAAKIFGRPGAIIITLAAIISTLGALHGWILLQGQIPLAATHDRLFPAIFSIKNRCDIPIYGLIISSILITMLLILNYHDSLVSAFTLIILLATMSILLVYFLTAMAQFKFLLKNNINNKNNISLYFITLIAALYIIFAIIGAGEKIIFYGMLLFLSGIPIYILTTRNAKNIYKYK